MTTFKIFKSKNFWNIKLLGNWDLFKHHLVFKWNNFNKLNIASINVRTRKNINHQKVGIENKNSKDSLSAYKPLNENFRNWY